MTISLRYSGELLLIGLILIFLFALGGERREVAELFSGAASMPQQAMRQQAMRQQVPAGAAMPATAANYAALPMAFEANRGQTAQSVRFLARGRGYGLFLTSDEAVLSLHKTQSGTDSANTDRVLRMRLIGGKRAPQMLGTHPLPGRSHYFIGSDPKQWRRDVPNYGKVLSQTAGDDRVG